MAVHVLAFTAKRSILPQSQLMCRSKAAWHIIGAMIAVLCWGSASRRGLGSLTSNTRLVDCSETPRTATNLCQSETCRGPDFISVAEALFRPSVTWRRGAARSLGNLATPTPIVSTWLEILSWLCSSATDQRRRRITQRSLIYWNWDVNVVGARNYDFSSTMVEVRLFPDPLSEHQIPSPVDVDVFPVYPPCMAALQISRIPASGQHPHGAW